MRKLVYKIDRLIDRINKHEVDWTKYGWNDLNDEPTWDWDDVDDKTQRLIDEINELTNGYMAFDNIFTDKVDDIVHSIESRVSKLEIYEQPNLNETIDLLTKLKSWLVDDSSIFKNYLELRSLSFNLFIDLKKRGYMSKDLENIIEWIDKYD